MAVLTITDERLREVDEFARAADRSRNEIVDEAIDRYLRKQEFQRISTDIREAFAQARITEKDVENAISEVRSDRAKRK